MSRPLTSLIAVTLIGVWSSVALAQSRTGTTGSSGSPQNAASALSSATGNTGTTGTTGTANTGGSTGGTAGGNTGAQTAAPVGNEPTFNAGDGSLGDQVGQGFTGRQNTGFVGNRNAGAANAAMLTPLLNQFSNQNQTNRGSTSNSNVKRARPQLRIAFSNPKVDLSQTQVVMNDRLGRLAGIQGVGTSISEQGVVTLTGTVTSEDSKKLAEALARLEPGVRSVKNELQVTTAP